MKLLRHITDVACWAAVVAAIAVEIHGTVTGNNTQVHWAFAVGITVCLARLTLPALLRRRHKQPAIVFDAPPYPAEHLHTVHHHSVGINNHQP